MGLARGPCCCRVLVEVVARVEKDAVLKEAAIRTDIRVTKRFSRSARTPVHSLEYIDPNVVHSIFNIQPSYPPETENTADMMPKRTSSLVNAFNSLPTLMSKSFQEVLPEPVAKAKTRVGARR